MDKSICGNCGRWREEHYDATGAFVGARQQFCEEYQGEAPSSEQLATREQDIAARREALKSGRCKTCGQRTDNR